MSVGPRTRHLLRSGICIASLCVIGAEPALAHERYVVDEPHDVSVAEFVDDVLTGSDVVDPLIAGGIVLALAIGAYLFARPVATDVGAFRFLMDEYTEYVPWLLRLGFGIALIGAGFGGYFFSPAVEVEARLLQVGLGFALLWGIATRVVAVTTLGLYLAGLTAYPAIALQFEYVGGMIAITLLGSGKPSLEHVLEFVARTPGSAYGRVGRVHETTVLSAARIEGYQQVTPTIIRVGLGLTFVYLSVSEKLLRPGQGLAAVEKYGLATVIPVDPALWVTGAAMTELGLGLALIVGCFTRLSAAAALSVFAATMFAFPDDPVLAHVAMSSMAISLVITGCGPYGLDNRIGSLEGEKESGAGVRSPATRSATGSDRRRQS